MTRFLTVVTMDSILTLAENKEDKNIYVANLPIFFNFLNTLENIAEDTYAFKDEIDVIKLVNLRKICILSNFFSTMCKINSIISTNTTLAKSKYLISSDMCSFISQNVNNIYSSKLPCMLINRQESYDFIYVALCLSLGLYEHVNIYFRKYRNHTYEVIDIKYKYMSFHRKYNFQLFNKSVERLADMFDTICKWNEDNFNDNVLKQMRVYFSYEWRVTIYSLELNKKYDTNKARSIIYESEDKKVRESVIIDDQQFYKLFEDISSDDDHPTPLENKSLPPIVIYSVPSSISK